MDVLWLTQVARSFKMDMTGSGTCVCGKEMTGCGGSFGGVLTTTWRDCECGIKALFYVVQKSRIG